MYNNLMLTYYRKMQETKKHLIHIQVVDFTQASVTNQLICYKNFILFSGEIFLIDIYMIICLGFTTNLLWRGLKNSM